MDRGGRLISNIRIDSPPIIDNTQKIIMGRFIKNEWSASMLPESRLCNLELAAHSHSWTSHTLIDTIIV